MPMLKNKYIKYVGQNKSYEIVNTKHLFLIIIIIMAEMAVFNVAGYLIRGEAQMGNSTMRGTKLK